MLHAKRDQRGDRDHARPNFRDGSAKGARDGRHRDVDRHRIVAGTSPRLCSESMRKGRTSRSRASRVDLASCRTSATMSAVRSAKGVWTATTSSAPGTTGSFIAAPAPASQGSRSTACRASRSRKKAAGSSSISPAPASAIERRTPPTRWRVRSCAPRGLCGLPGFRPRRWTKPTPAFRVRSFARPRVARGGASRRRDAAHPPQCAEVPRLRRLLFQERARLHLAMLDHPVRRRRRDGPGL